MEKSKYSIYSPHNYYVFIFTCLFWSIQYITQDRSLIFFEEIQQFKITQVVHYFFNPFKGLNLLPHGLYSYSSLLSIALIFPFFLLLGSYHTLRSKIQYWIFFILMAGTIFFCFSRFEILSVLMGLSIIIFVIKDREINKISLLWLIIFFAMIIISMVAYFYYVFNGWSTIAARIISSEVITTLFQNWWTILIGNEYAHYNDHFTIGVPHNIFVYSLFAFGFSGLLLVLYFGIHGIQHFKFLVQYGYLYSFSIYKVSTMICFYLLYVIFIRGFDYYILDGYENILTIFFCILLLDILKFQNVFKEPLTITQTEKLSVTIT